MKKVLFIVVTFNGMRWLERCLSSIPVEAGIFIVDNDSTDGSADFVTAHFPRARVVRSAENLLFAKANNLGHRYALEKGYDYVYLMNQDAWLEEGALERLVAAAEAHPEYAVLSPLQMTEGFTGMDREFGKILRFAQHDRRNAQSDICPVSRVMAAHWLVPAGALRKIGLFNEDLFPLYGQDDDWCNRARHFGMRIGIVPAARGVHDRASRQESKEKIIRRNYFTGSLCRLCDLNRPLWERFLFVCLFTLVKSVKYRSFLPLKYFRELCSRLPEIRRTRRSAASGAWGI